MKNKVHPSPQLPSDVNNNSEKNTEKTNEVSGSDSFDEDESDDRHTLGRQISDISCLCSANDKCNHRPRIGLPSELFATNIGFQRKQSTLTQSSEKSNSFYPLSRSNSSPCHRKVVQRTSERKANSLRMQRSNDGASCDPKKESDVT